MNPIGMIADVLTDAAFGAGEHFTCSEADTIAVALTEGGFRAEAEIWLRGHMIGDDEGDSHDPDWTTEELSEYLDSHLS